MVKWTPKSEDDLDELRDYIAKNFNVELAIEIANSLIILNSNLSNKRFNLSSQAKARSTLKN
jgi:hypothetical protein